MKPMPVVAVLALLAGCASGGGGGTGTSSLTGQSSPAATAPPPAGGPAALTRPTRCRTGQLAGGLLRAEGAAGNVYVSFRLRNVSAAACTVQGYIGTRLLDAAGRPLPTALSREPGPRPRITLRPGASAYFFLRFPNPGLIDPTCRPPSAHRLRVTPPDERTSLTVSGRAPDGSYPVRPCRGRLRTAPLSPTSP